MELITLYLWDELGVFAGSIQCDPMKGVPVRSTPTPTPGSPPEGKVWLWEGMWVAGDTPTPTAPPQAPELSQFERDRIRYEKRAAIKDQLLAYMAADNMSRVRSGVWTVADLTGLLADPAVAAANQFMSTLSFELAAQAIAAASTPLLTPEIRADWVSRLQAAFFTEG